jgi:hypothetical protein
MTGITMYLSILTLNVNGLNSPIKRHHLANWIKKEAPTICCLQETHLINICICPIFIYIQLFLILLSPPHLFFCLEIPWIALPHLICWVPPIIRSLFRGHQCEWVGRLDWE